METFASLALSLWGRVFLFVAIGYGLGRFWGRRLSHAIRWFVAASIYGLLPVFVFVLMWSSVIEWARFGRLAVLVVGVLAGGALSARVLARRWNWPFRDLCLPVVFMNSIYLALPVNTVLFGAQGAAATLVFNIVVTIVHFTVGIWWVRREGRSALSEVLGIPIVYSTFAGTALNFAGVPCPEEITALSSLLAQVALPAMLVILGIRMAEVPREDWRQARVGVLFRMAGGGVTGWLLAVVLGLEGVERGVAIVTAAMPPAVNTYVLAEKFECRPTFAAAMVTVGTLVSAVTVPLLGWLLR